MTLAVNQLTFKSEVLESSRPVLVSFWAPWCGICRLTQPMLSDLQLEWGDQIKLVQINADENLTLSSTYRITTLPTIILLERGEVCCRFDQFRGREDFRQAAAEIQTVLKQVSLSYSCSA
jgi:thioredoxin 1